MFFKKASYQVICIGSTSKDVFFPTDEAIIIETPEDITSKRKIAFELGGKYQVDDRFEAIGGVAANVSSGLARLGHRVSCYSNVGHDEMGQWLAAELRTEGVATEHLSHDTEAKTDLSAIVVMTQNGERTIFHNRDANERLVVRPDRLAHTQWLFVSALNGPWRENLTAILQAKKIHNCLLAFNPGQHNIKEDSEQVLAAMKETDLLLLNKDEAIELMLKSFPETAHAELDDEVFLLKQLYAAGAKVIGMTDGRRGSWGYDGKEYWYCPIYTRTEVVDSTGAGDAFGSGFMASWLANKSLPQALQAGMANSGSVVGFYGAIAGLLEKKTLETITTHIIPKRLD